MRPPERSEHGDLCLPDREWMNTGPEVEFLRYFHEVCDGEGLLHGTFCWEMEGACDLVERVRFLARRP